MTNVPLAWPQLSVNTEESDPDVYISVNFCLNCNIGENNNN